MSEKSDQAFEEWFTTVEQRTARSSGKAELREAWNASRAASGFPTKIIRAFRPGDIVFVECARDITMQESVQIREQFAAYVPKLKIVLLGAGMRVAGAEQKDAPEPTEKQT